MTTVHSATANASPQQSRSQAGTGDTTSIKTLFDDTAAAAVALDNATMLVKKALIIAVTARTPPRTLSSLALRLGCNRATLWRNWHDSPATVDFSLPRLLEEICLLNELDDVFRQNAKPSASLRRRLLRSFGVIPLTPAHATSLATSVARLASRIP